MRGFLSVLSLLLAGVFATVSLASWQVDQLLRSPEPLQQIAGDLPEREEFSEVTAELIVDDLSSRLPSAISAMIPQGAEQSVSGLIVSTLGEDRTVAAWQEILDTTRSQYTNQLENLFHQGTTGDTAELDIEVDLSPVAAAITEPLRTGLDRYSGWIPGVNLETFEFLAPEIVVDIETVTDDDADPYLWASAAGLSTYWMVMSGIAVVLIIFGVTIGLGRLRWIGLGLGALTAVILGGVIAVTAASPQLNAPAGSGAAMVDLLQLLQERITTWAQPAWWWFIGVAMVLLIACALRLVLYPRAAPRPKHDV